MIRQERKRSYKSERPHSGETGGKTAADGMDAAKEEKVQTQLPSLDHST